MEMDTFTEFQYFTSFHDYSTISLYFCYIMELNELFQCSTKGFLEILSNVLAAQETNLSFTYGSPDESCSSFALMYFGKRRASWINLF